MKDIINRLIKFRNDRNWSQFHSPQNLSKSIMIKAAELLEPTLTGYTFAGWYEDMALTIPFEETTMPEEDITLYAKWALE
jgi:uncharacterized repeat protein (TIGR02543 family)